MYLVKRSIFLNQDVYKIPNKQGGFREKPKNNKVIAGTQIEMDTKTAKPFVDCGAIEKIKSSTKEKPTD